MLVEMPVHGVPMAPSRLPVRSFVVVLVRARSLVGGYLGSYNKQRHKQGQPRDRGLDHHL
jgi:hypothetical protein